MKNGKKKKKQRRRFVCRFASKVANNLKIVNKFFSVCQGVTKVLLENWIFNNIRFFSCSVSNLFEKRGFLLNEFS